MNRKIIGASVGTPINPQALMEKAGIDFKADAIVTSASGEVIATTDSIKAKMQGFKLFGKCEQRQYEGNQLLQYPYISTSESYHGITTTDNGDGSITFTGTNNNTSGDYYYNLFLFEGSRLKLKAGTYTVSTLGLVDGLIFQFHLEFTNRYIVNGETFTITEDDEANVYVIILSGKTVNTTIYPMLNEGTQALPFEPFVGNEPSPNMNYPQEIKCIGESGSIGGKVIETNVFDMESIINAYENGEYEKEPLSGYYVTQIPLAPNTQYYLKSNGVRQSTQVCLISKYKQVNAEEREAIGVSNNWNSEACVTTSDDGLLYIGITNDIAVIREMLESALVQIEVGTEATEYKPYTEQPFTLTTPVPITKWDKLVKRDGVWGWSIFGKEYNLSGDEVTLQANSGGSEKIRIYIHNAVAKKYSECRCNIIRYDSGSPNIGYGNYFFADKFGAIIPNSWLEPYGYVYNTEADDSSVNYPNAIAAFKAMLADKGGIQIWVDMQEEQAFHPLPDEEQTLLNNLVMNYPNTTIVNDEGAYMEVEYVADTKCYIDNKFKELAVALANTNANLL
jgi:hypothetical protein